MNNISPDIATVLITKIDVLSAFYLGYTCRSFFNLVFKNISSDTYRIYIEKYMHIDEIGLIHNMTSMYMERVLKLRGNEYQRARI